MLGTDTVAGGESLEAGLNFRVPHPSAFFVKCVGSPSTSFVSNALNRLTQKTFPATMRSFSMLLWPAPVINTN
jgi:hypothetical protein